jgi:hypothetical protein
LILPALLAGFIAAAISASELITAKYARTCFLLIRCGWLWAYALIYGLIGFGVTLGFDSLVASEAIHVQGLGLTSPWVRAVVIGLSVKAILHINLFNVTVGAQSRPIGIESLVQLFEPAMLRNILLREFLEARNYVTPYAASNPNLVAVKQQIKANVPASLEQLEKAAFENDVDKAESVPLAMEHFLRFLGRKIFERTFNK